MVRVKSRYLVVNYLYPDSVAPSKSTEPVPDFIQFYQPSPDQFQPGLLIKGIRESVAELFGDYGLGMVTPQLKSRSNRL